MTVIIRQAQELILIVQEMILNEVKMLFLTRTKFGLIITEELIMPWKPFITQWKYLSADYSKIVGNSKFRKLYSWLNPSAIAVFSYRFDRSFFMLFGNSWMFIRILFKPFFLILQCFSHCEIDYRANIGPGIKILHPSMGLYVSHHTIAGAGLILTGGNLIGRKSYNPDHYIIIGDKVNVGANAVILGPIKVGSKVTVGAMSLVNKDVEDFAVVAGVPAKIINKVPVNPLSV